MSNVNSIIAVIATPTASSMPNVIEPIGTIAGDFVSNVDSIAAVVATPVATEVQVIASNVAQVVEGVRQNASAVPSNILSEVQLLASSITQVIIAVEQTTAPAVVITQLAIPGIGSIATNPGNIATVILNSATEFIIGLLNVPLNAVSPVLTNATLPMLSVSYLFLCRSSLTRSSRLPPNRPTTSSELSYILTLAIRTYLAGSTLGASAPVSI